MNFRDKYIRLYTEFFYLRIFCEPIINVASITTELPLQSEIYHVVTTYFLGGGGMEKFVSHPTAFKSWIIVVAYLVEALCYKAVGCGIEIRCRFFFFQFT
jgi:hypothetical protein